MVTPQHATSAIHSEARNFLAKFRSLQMATVSSSGEPLASYAPFARLNNGRFGLLLSDLAAHTHNLRHNPQASILLIESEDQSQEIFARRRLVCTCKAELHPSGSDTRAEIVTALHSRFGDTVDQLASLPDFHGVVLQPTSANYIAGFARAHSMDINTLFADGNS